MKTLFETIRATETSRKNTRPQLVRTYVETGDPRCPLAGIWLQLAEHDAAGGEDPESLRPTMGAFLAWWASMFHLSCFALPAIR